MQDLEQYKNIDGTYTSPKNGRSYKSVKALRSHLNFKKTEKFHSFAALNKQKENCQYCSRSVAKTTISLHENTCYLNPAIIVPCNVCGKPIRNYRTSKGTCSHSCSNKHFRSGVDNGNYKGDEGSGYAAICYRYHKKECVVCGESDAVDVHHLDHNRNNNSPINLLPLCPTHHAYCHRNLYHKIEEQINRYITEFNLAVV